MLEILQTYVLAMALPALAAFILLSSTKGTTDGGDY